MTMKEACLIALDDLKAPQTTTSIYDHINKHSLYDFGGARTPKASIGALLGTLIKNGDSRVKRILQERGSFLYYLSKNEILINLEEDFQPQARCISKVASYHERDLHKLLSTYLNSKNTLCKTILHEKSRGSADNHQKWIHPDMIGVKFNKINNSAAKDFLKAINLGQMFKLSSYEIKKSIKTDYELKKAYFQAVSNSSWSNYGYLVVFDLNATLYEEIERLNQSFGIGVLELKANPFESKIVFQAKHKELDFNTVEKLCNVNKNFEEFIFRVGNLLTADQKYVKSVEQEFESNFCDKFFINDSEVLEFCKDKNIPHEEELS